MYMIVEKATGKVVADEMIFFGRPKRAWDKGFVKVFTAFLDSIVDNEEIAGKSIRLLFYMMGKLDYNSYKVEIIPSKVIRELGIGRDTFYRWVNTLEKHKIIRKIDRYTYEITPYLFVKGDSSKAMENLLEGGEGNG